MGAFSTIPIVVLLASSIGETKVITPVCDPSRMSATKASPVDPGESDAHLDPRDGRERGGRVNDGGTI
jgi:hypothetical protein